MPHVARYFSQRAYDTAFEPCFKKSKLDDSASWEKQSVAPQKSEAQSCVQSSAAFSDDKNNGSGKSNHGKAAAKDYFLSSSDFVPLSEPAKKVASEKRQHNFTPPKTEQQKSDHDSGAAFSATSSEFIGPLYQPPPQGVSAISNCKNTGKKQLAYKIKTVALGNSKRPLENNNEMDYELQQFYKELLQLEADDQNIGQTNAEDQTELEYRNAPSPAQANIPPIQTSLPPPCNSFPSNSSALMPLHSHQNEKPVSPAKHPALPPDDYNTCNRLAPLRETSPVFVSQALPPRSFEGPPPYFVPRYGPPPPRFDYPLRFPQENNLLRPPFPENHQPNMVIDYHRPRTQPPRCNSPATPQSVFSPHGGNFTKPNIELAASFSQQEHPRGELLELEATDDQNIGQTTSEDQLVHRCRNAPPAKANLPPFQTYPSPQYNSFSSNSSALMPLHSHQNEKPVSPAKHPALPPDDYNTCNRLAPLRETSPVFVSQALPPQSLESPPPYFVPQYGPPPPRFDYPLRFPQENNLLRPPFPENHQPNMVIDYHRPRTQPPRCNSPATPRSVFSPHGGNFTKPNIELAASFSQQEHPRGELLELEATEDQNIGQTTSEDQLVHRCRNAPPAKANLPPFQTYPSPQYNSFSSNSSALMSLHSHRNDKAVSPAKPLALPPDDHNICNRVAPLRETRPSFLSQALSPAGVEDPAPPSFMPRYGPPPSRFDHPLHFPQENNLLRLPFLENHQPNMIDHHRPRAQPPFHNSPATPESMFSPQGGNYTKPHLEPPFNFSQREHHQGDLGGWRGRPVGELSLPRAANGPHEQYTHETHRFRDAAPCTYSAKKLVLLRGLPGSGKSTLACTLLSQAHDGIVLSTDDYFCQENGYTYDVKLLGDAHTWNHNRARKAMDDGRSPIIIDNTNIQSWEMKPYVHMAMDHGYEVEFLEPNTWWKLDPSELEKRNTHRVPREKISQMLERFELNMTVGIVMNSVEPRHKRSNRPPPEARASVKKKKKRHRRGRKTNPNKTMALTQKDHEGSYDEYTAESSTKEDHDHMYVVFHDGLPEEMAVCAAMRILARAQSPQIHFSFLTISERFLKWMMQNVKPASVSVLAKPASVSVLASPASVFAEPASISVLDPWVVVALTQVMSYSTLLPWQEHGIGCRSKEKAELPTWSQKLEKPPSTVEVKQFSSTTIERASLKDRGNMLDGNCHQNLMGADRMNGLWPESEKDGCTEKEKERAPIVRKRKVYKLAPNFQHPRIFCVGHENAFQLDCTKVSRRQKMLMHGQPENPEAAYKHVNNSIQEKNGCKDEGHAKSCRHTFDNSGLKLVGDKSSFSCGLHLPETFVRQLVRLFGSPGVRMDTLLPEDYIVPLDQDLSRRLYLRWKHTLESRH